MRHRPVDGHGEPLAARVAHQPRPQLLGVQTDVLGEALRDRQPHRVRSQHEPTMIGERTPHRPEQRMHTIRLDDRRTRVTTDRERVHDQVTKRPGGQRLGSGRHIVDLEGHHRAILLSSGLLGDQ